MESTAEAGIKQHESLLTGSQFLHTGPSARGDGELSPDPLPSNKGGTTIATIRGETATKWSSHFFLMKVTNFWVICVWLFCCLSCQRFTVNCTVLWNLDISATAPTTVWLHVSVFSIRIWTALSAVVTLSMLMHFIYTLNIPAYYWNGCWRNDKQESIEEEDVEMMDSEYIDTYARVLELTAHGARWESMMKALIADIETRACSPSAYSWIKLWHIFLSIVLDICQFRDGLLSATHFKQINFSSQMFWCLVCLMSCSMCLRFKAIEDFSFSVVLNQFKPYTIIWFDAQLAGCGPTLSSVVSCQLCVIGVVYFVNA